MPRVSHQSSSSASDFLCHLADESAAWQQVAEEAQLLIARVARLKRTVSELRKRAALRRREALIRLRVEAAQERLKRLHVIRSSTQ